MIGAAFHAGIYAPLYNGLVYFVDIVPGHDVGLAVIALTIVVRVVLFPLSRQAVRTQAAMREIAPQVEEIKVRLKDKQDEQAKAIFALYKENNIRPFSSFFLLLVQFPILLGLYWVFGKAGLPHVNPDLLYAFVKVPESVNMHFLGLIDVGGRSILLAVCAGLTQLVYARLSMGPRSRPADTEFPSFSNDMAKSFDIQARYVLPVIVAGIAFTVSAAVPLYWTASNLFMIGQELLVAKKKPEKAKS